MREQKCHTTQNHETAPGFQFTDKHTVLKGRTLLSVHFDLVSFLQLLSTINTLHSVDHSCTYKTFLVLDKA